MKFPKLMFPVLALVLGILSFDGVPVGTVRANSSIPKTVTATSCNLSDVQHAVNQANAGDTVSIPAGTCIWTSTLMVNTAINLLGSTSDPTLIIDNVDRSNCADHPAIFMNISLNEPWRLANLTIQGKSIDRGICSENIKAVTNSHAFRIDHIIFNNMQTTGIFVGGDPWGVIDHSVFNGDHKRGVLIHHAKWQQVGASGDNSWAQPDTMGTAQAVFVEDSTFKITNASGSGSVACEYGGRCVARYNTLPFLGTHGTDSSARFRSVRHFEIYNNVITDNGTAVGQAMQLRGGTALFFNNTITPTVGGSYGGILALETYREADGFKPWGLSSSDYRGACDGSGPFDKNDGIVYDGGTYKGNSGVHDTLTDTAKHWTTNQWVGYSLRNTTTGPWGASVKSNTPTTIATFPSTRGTPAMAHTWNAGDKYEILKVYPCLDQPGRGAGRYISGGGPGIQPAPSKWPDQAIDPIYAWNNRFKGTLVAAIGRYYTHVEPNRDYYDWTAAFDGSSGVGQGPLSTRPASCTPLVAYWATDINTLYQCSAKNTWTTYYKPFTYPHPLQGSPPPLPRRPLR